MNSWVQLLNGLALRWEISMWRACWQGGLALLIVWLICRAINRLPASVKAWLWRLAFAKCLIAFFWNTPIDLPLLPLVQSARAGGALETTTKRSPIAAQPLGVLRTEPVPVPSDAEACAVSSLRRPAWLFIFWSFGLLAGGAKLTWQFHRARALRRNSRVINDPALLREAEETASGLRLKRVPELATSQQITGPVLFGIIRPLVVLPATLLSEIPPASLRMILAHEMAHIKRRDLVWVLFCTMAERFFFVHPVVWCVRREWRMTQEMACDELAIGTTKSSHADYAAMLLEIVCRNTQESPAIALSIVETKEGLETRIRGMKNIRSMSRTRMLTICAATSLAAATGIIPWRLVAQSQVGSKIKKLECLCGS